MANWGTRGPLDRAEVVRMAELNRIRPDSYSLDGLAPERGYVLDVTPQGWAVARCQQGQRVSRETFAGESAAHKALLVALLQDESTHRPEAPGTSLAIVMIVIAALALPFMGLVVLGAAIANSPELGTLLAWVIPIGIVLLGGLAYAVYWLMTNSNR